MPYSNVPEDKWDDMDRCVKDIMAKQGVDKPRAIAICHSSIVKSEPVSFIMKRLWTQGMRDKLSSGEMEGEFAGPDQSFPVASPEDVSAAYSSLGRAKGDRDKIKRNIIRIAKKYGWESGLPKTVKSLSGVITKAQRMPDGRVKWRARVNSGEFDLEGEKFDLTYFEDLVDNFAFAQEALSKSFSFPIERALDDGTIFSLPLPITDIAHYSYFIDVRNKARTGYPIKMWIDGKALMAEGYFDDTELGNLAAKSAMAERDIEKRRMSIGTMPDWGLVEYLDDGRRIFKGGRKRAYIDHLAQTACPVDTDTEILLLSTEVDMPTQKQDAIDVLGEEAEEIVDGLEKSKVKSEAAGALLKGDAEVTGVDTGTEKPEGEKPEGEKGEGLEGEELEGEKPEGKPDDEIDDEITQKAKTVVRTTIEGLIKALPAAISKAVETHLSTLELGNLPTRLSSLEASVKSLAAGETEKLKAAIESKDANWMEELLTKNMSEYSVQHGSGAVVKGESKPEVAGKSASTPRADKEFDDLFGNPPETKS